MFTMTPISWVVGHSGLLVQVFVRDGEWLGVLCSNVLAVIHHRGHFATTSGVVDREAVPSLARFVSASKHQSGELIRSDRDPVL